MDQATLSTHYFNVKGLEPCRNEVKTVISLLRSLQRPIDGLCRTSREMCHESGRAAGSSSCCVG